MLLAGERADDLLRNNLKIIQSDGVFSFSMDAVLLAHFCSVPAKGKVMDLCTGNGVIPILLSARSRADIWGVEIQEKLADMASRSIRLNGLEDRLHILCGDLNHIHSHTGTGVYDMVTVNPPYLPVSAGEQNANAYIAAARHEIYCNLEEVVAACSRLLRYGGKVAMVHRPGRLADILIYMRQYGLEPKRVRFVHPKASEEANMVLVEGMRGGKADLRLLPPLVVYNDGGGYTAELMSIYYSEVEHPGVWPEGGQHEDTAQFRQPR